MIDIMTIGFDTEFLESLSNIILTLMTILGTMYGIIKWYNHKQKTRVRKEMKCNDIEKSIVEIKEGHQKIIDKIEDSIQNIKNVKNEQDHIIIALTLTSTKFKKIYEDIIHIKKDRNEND